MTNSAEGNNITKTHDALTKGDYDKLHAVNDAKVRSELGKETENERQKRIWAKENEARRGELGS